MQKNETIRIGQLIRKRVVTGFLVIAPLAATVFVLKWLLGALAGILAPVVKRIFGEDLPWLQNVTSIFLLLALLYLIGLLGSNIAGRWLIDKFERIVSRIPLASAVYASVRQVVQTFGPQNENAFERVVWVRFPTPDAFAVGFVTGEIKGAGNSRLLKVFVPTAPNPTSGFLLVVDPSSIRESGMTIEQAIQMVVSGGIASPESANIPGVGGDDSSVPQDG